MGIKPVSPTTLMVAGALLLAACGSTTADQATTAELGEATPTATTATAQPSGNFNDADVMFTQMMIMHHRQAVEMARLAPARASDEQVKAIAAKIKSEQEREIETMQGWLKAWGKPMSTGGMGHEMPGGMSQEDMRKLGAARGAAFDKEFLQMMTNHHRSAIMMAGIEQRLGANPQAKQLARSIAASQEAEVAQMRKILDRLK
ncbi:DUF305 domain-containing protein [Nonomuraea sp. M3C6]|uniref:DUF305 domain-containing protein n=1 Tax=Nonomuraea marmarensis TaxID=3351344 RepID=A0ABW7AUC9_9ACTN